MWLPSRSCVSASCGWCHPISQASLQSGQHEPLPACLVSRRLSTQPPYSKFNQQQLQMQCSTVTTDAINLYRTSSWATHLLAPVSWVWPCAAQHWSSNTEPTSTERSRPKWQHLPSNNPHDDDDSSVKQSNMACVNKALHTCHLHLYPQVEWTTSQPQSIITLWLALISHPAEGRRLSWHKWLGYILRWYAHHRRTYILLTLFNSYY